MHKNDCLLDSYTEAFVFRNIGLVKPRPRHLVLSLYTYTRHDDELICQNTRLACMDCKTKCELNMWPESVLDGMWIGQVMIGAYK